MKVNSELEHLVKICKNLTLTLRSRSGQFFQIFGLPRLLNFEKRLKHGRFCYKNDQVRWILAYNFVYRPIDSKSLHVRRGETICLLYLGKLLSILLSFTD